MNLSLEAVRAATDRIHGRAVRTPLLEAHALSTATGGRIFVKPEVLQRTGSFKFRGAYNALAALPPERRVNGVVAVSSGNHAQGVAEAARLFGIPATIVMPADAPATPVHDRLAAHNAVWGASFGLEHPLWFQEPGQAPIEEVTFRRSNAWSQVAAECTAVRESVGLIEIFQRSEAARCPLLVEEGDDL